MSELPADTTGKAMAVATMMYENAANFLQSHSLKVDMSEARTIDDKKSSRIRTSPQARSTRTVISSAVPHRPQSLRSCSNCPRQIGSTGWQSHLLQQSRPSDRWSPSVPKKFFGAGSQLAGGFPGAGLFGKNNVAQQYNYEPAQYAQNLAYSAQVAPQ
ncbi:unnamed protein product [Trichogramma brassicae]|uniref:Uncharacterized protein n=1 Tax=Trichogramma brassicae TaxID=86971 RepID=A0A6H5J5N5_9HYME|nr:unnamed protein product [Trichogramma brassicae]